MRDAAIYYNNSEKKGKGKVWLLILAVLIFSAVSYGAYFTWKIHNASRKMNAENKNGSSYINSVETIISTVVSPKHKSLEGEENGRINILLLGVAGENWPGKNLTDTIMIASIDTKNKKVALLSLPRDLYVEIPGTNYSTKINQIYQYGLKNNEGVELIKKTAENVTGLDIQYFLAVDFEGFKKVIGDIGGINIMVERDIYDPRYPGPNYSYETFEISKGLRHMNGDTALKYARERHDDPEGDFGRAKRQQQVIQAVKNRAFSVQTFLNPITLNNLLNTLGNHVKTNIGLSEIESFIALSGKVDTQNITNVVADAWKKDSLLKGSHLSTSNGWASILVPRVGNFSEVADLAQNIFDLDVIKRRQAEIEKESASVAIVNQSEDKDLADKIRGLLKDKLNINNVNVVYYQVRPYANETKVVDNTSKQKVYTLDELLKKLPAKLGEASGDIADLKDKYDMVIILGNDIIKKYSFEEASFEEYNKAENDEEEIIIKNQ